MPDCGLLGYILRNGQRKAVFYARQLFSRRPQCTDMADRVEKIKWIQDESADIPEDLKKRYMAFDEKERKDMIDEPTKMAQELLKDKPMIEGFQVQNPFPFVGPWETLHTWYHILFGADLGSSRGNSIIWSIIASSSRHPVNLLVLNDYVAAAMVDSEWSCFIDSDQEKMEVWEGTCLVEEVTFDILREDPVYMRKAF
ncbi:hypothetical protein IAR50_001694 [Cryptococcus sp. DSM 104548]